MDELKTHEQAEIWVGNEKFLPYLSEEKIQNRIAELGKELTEDYRGKFPIFIGILNGSFIFFSDLIRRVQLNCEIDFYKLSSYGDEKISSGNVRLLKELNADINDRHVVIVEDIVDSGLSIKYIQDMMGRYNPASIKIVSLLYKPEAIKYNVKIDYIGFEIPNKFVLGFGLDYAQKYRNLRSIYALSEEEN